MKIYASVLMGMALLQPLYAIGGYRCTDKCLCEVQDYSDASSFTQAFTEGKLSGQLRLAYINQDNHRGDPAATDGSFSADKTTYATSIGGQLKYETARFYNVSVAAAFFVSHKINGLNGDDDKGALNYDFYGTQADSITYLGEAYVNYASGKFDLRVGRQKLDTPLNDRDDIRMLPNTFEAAMAGYGGVKDFVFIVGYVTKMAGYDSGDDIAKFKDIPGETATGEIGEGLLIGGIQNESFENIELQAWYYGFDKLADVIYADGIYAAEYESGLSVEGGLQYGNYSERLSSTVEGKIYGAMLTLSYSGLSLGGAFNSVHTDDGKITILGFGGGPYFTSMEEMTIDSINDVEAYVLSAEYDFSELSFDGLSLFYAYGHFDGNDAGIPFASAMEYDEHDIVIAYSLADNIDFEASYAMVNDTASAVGDDTSYDRFLFRANYNF